MSDLIDMNKLCRPFLTEEDIEEENSFFMYETVLVYDETKSDECHKERIAKAIEEFNVELSVDELFDLLKARGDLERLDLALLNYQKNVYKENEK